MKIPKNPIEFLNKLFNLFDEVPLTEEETDEELRGMGIDPVECGKRTEEFVRKLIKKDENDAR